MTIRELPDHDLTTFEERRYEHALVIPVINEGERIQRQLQRIRQASPKVDIIIADGGSTDHSLDPALLRDSGVRALLVKRGAGKLSAQLRMAYAWALDQGYAGIVTIDGNGKDGVEAIDDFVDALADGYDYVQGSRYVPGGHSENTPWERWFAGRLIHAPVMSVAGRRRFSDTTNGFRAYSSAYLKDPSVAPFRNVFDRYQLLFYLTIRAGQLGYRVKEIPVSRTYPAAGPIPSKIGGVRSKVEHLLEVFSVALGFYHPRHRCPRADTALRRTRRADRTS
jgi:dolichol-phosphate mannosyltransferase